jgi:hypothetical protein
MGWTFTYKAKGEPVRAFFETQFNYSKEDGRSGKIIASAVKFRTAYFAFEIKTPGQPDEVVALVCLLSYRPKDYSYNFGYKDMDETMGPNESECPAAILDLLTPTTSEYALSWRKRCRERLEAKAKAPRVSKGDWIKFSSPQHFRSGMVGQVFKFIRHSLFMGVDGWRYRMGGNWRENEFINCGKVCPQ